MKHARNDYDRIQDPALNDPTLLGNGCTPIAEDEPVFLLRAKDKHFQAMIRQYMMLVSSDPDSDIRLVEALTPHILLASDWQTRNGTKSPDMPND